MSLKRYSTQLVDRATNMAIIAPGGVVFVALPGTSQKAPLRNADGEQISNPVAINNGMVEFHTLDTVQKVDIYVQAPSGHFIVVKDVFPSGNNAIYVDKKNSLTTFVIPFSIEDTAENAETQTGFTHPVGALALPTPTVEVTTEDATETIDVGTLSSDSGDADGYIDGASVAAKGVVKATLAFGSVTLGVQLQALAGTGSTLPVPEGNVSMGGKQITYTLSAGTDEAEGFIKIPFILSQAAL